MAVSSVVRFEQILEGALGEKEKIWAQRYAKQVRESEGFEVPQPNQANKVFVEKAPRCYDTRVFAIEGTEEEETTEEISAVAAREEKVLTAVSIGKLSGGQEARHVGTISNDKSDGGKMKQVNTSRDASKVTTDDVLTKEDSSSLEEEEKEEEEIEEEVRRTTRHVSSKATEKAVKEDQIDSKTQNIKPSIPAGHKRSCMCAICKQARRKEEQALKEQGMPLSKKISEKKKLSFNELELPSAEWEAYVITKDNGEDEMVYRSSEGIPCYSIDMVPQVEKWRLDKGRISWRNIRKAVSWIRSIGVTSNTSLPSENKDAALDAVVLHRIFNLGSEKCVWQKPSIRELDSKKGRGASSGDTVEASMRKRQRKSKHAEPSKLD